MKSLEELAAELQGYDPHALPASAVHAFLQRWVEPIRDVERVALPAARERILAQAVVAPMDVPPHDNAAMDGYAVRGADLHPSQPTTLQVLGTCYA
ncbi:MAG: molybdopterin molybdenumtransferase MoeA, partial [Burkholderiales bacterium]|nr:molybdopterin molybdenumtransferase MoeA [Burkholderiales bacterium]